MAMKLKTWIGLSGALLTLSLSSAACSGGGGGGGATPTPTPAALDISATAYYTQSGTSTIVPGECAGLEITDANGGFTENTTVTFTDAAGEPYLNPFTVYFDGATSADLPYVTLVSDSVIRVGLDFEPTDTTLPTGDYPCLNYGFGDLFEVGQSYGVLVEDGAASDTIASAFTVGPLPTAAGTFSTEGSASDSLATANQFDYFNVTSGAPNTAQVIGLLGSGATFTPTMDLYTTSNGQFSTVTNQGFFMMIERMGAGEGALPRRIVVSDTDVGTDPGFSYTLNVATSGTIAANVGNDTCTFGATPITADTVFTVNPEDGAANYNPNGAPGCADVNGGSSGVMAPGKDVAYRLTVPANTTVSIGGIPNGTSGDTVLYLLPNTGTANEAANCPLNNAAITACAAAADIFGANGTDSFTYRNATGAAQEFYLIVDEYGTGTAPGTSAPMTIAVDFQ